MTLSYLYNTSVDPLEVATLREGQDAELLERYANLIVFPDSTATKDKVIGYTHSLLSDSKASLFSKYEDFLLHFWPKTLICSIILL